MTPSNGANTTAVPKNGMNETAIAPQDPTYVLISVHGDPTAEIGKDGAGGQNVYVRELGAALSRQGCQVDMFTRRENLDQAEIVEHAPGLRTIRLTAGPAKFIPRTELFEYLPEFVEAWLEFQQRSSRNYVLLHTNYWLSGWVGLQLKEKLGLPQVHTYHSIGAVKYKSVKNPPAVAAIRHKVETDCLEQTDCVVATSPQEEAHLRKYISSSGTIKVIPCGIDTERFATFTQKEAREQLGIDPDAFLVLYVGRFDPRKGIETLVKACTQIQQPFQLYVIGGSRQGGADSREQGRIRELVKTLGLESSVTFTGRISQPQLPPYYAAANVCAVPSHYEPFGLVAIEAMAAGTPVIASRVGGLCHTVMHNKTGRLVPPRDPDALATELNSVCTDPITWSAYGTAGRTWVQQSFGHSAVATQMYDLYTTLRASTAELSVS
jgi:D-inositol-3-phosphate glycosyltransferase